MPFVDRGVRLRERENELQTTTPRSLKRASRDSTFVPSVRAMECALLASSMASRGDHGLLVLVVCLMQFDCDSSQVSLRIRRERPVVSSAASAEHNETTRRAAGRQDTGIFLHSGRRGACEGSTEIALNGR
jgi:hypothetical protein